MHAVSETPEWKDLEQHAQVMKQQHLFDLFQNDVGRFDRFSLDLGDMLFDYSKQLICEDTVDILIALATSAEVEAWRDRMMAGEKINITEDRAVLHTALRAELKSTIKVDGADIMPDVQASLAHVRSFARQVRDGEWLGHKGDPITDVVNIGIGGSDLGPQMVCDALQDTVEKPLNVHFVSNVDAVQISRVLKQLDPATTLFVVASKTFTTKETMINARTAKAWLLADAGDTGAVVRHFVATTAAPDKAIEFGIAGENVFESWDWVGGRFSLWSAIGLPIALALGFDTFESLLAGAREMDEHFKSSPLRENAPVIMALLGIWNSNFLGAASHAVLPYDHALRLFPAYMQQAEMESNGKSVTHAGDAVNYDTCPVIWGATGINGQHAFYQLLHQGTRVIPCDFIGSVKPQVDFEGHHEYLMANFLAQIQALAMGNTEEQVRAELEQKGFAPDRIEALLSHKVHDGNRPSTCLLLKELNARSLGKLIALYEHKIFVQGVIWRVCSFDQWGVELGKVMANRIQTLMEDECVSSAHDTEVQGPFSYFRKHRPSQA